MRLVRKNEFRENEEIRICGIFTEIKNKYLSLFREGNKLYFVIDSDIYLIDDTSSVDIKKIEKNKYQLSLFDDDNIVATYDYVKPHINPQLGLDPTPFIEEENFDFCLFIKNVVNDKDRRERMFRI
jgi:hypothetical protein